MAEGWQCPRCLRVLSPFVEECRHCNAGRDRFAVTEVVVPATLCPSCRRPRGEPAFTGCPSGSHYGTTCAVSVSGTLSGGVFDGAKVTATLCGPAHRFVM